MLDVRAPEWEPLLNFAPDHIDDFMWMYSVDLKDGTRLQAYKHYWTRRHLHLDGKERAYVFQEDRRYREVAARWLLMMVLREDLAVASANIVGQILEDVDFEEMEVKWTRSATRHRISRERSRDVLQRCGLRYRERLPYDDGDPIWRDDRILFLGDDADGIPLEGVAVEMDEEEFLVIHAMALRDRHRWKYEEAKRWRR
jgi:hypothetical protein